MRFPVVYLPCCSLPCCKGSLGNSQKKVCAISFYDVFCHLVTAWKLFGKCLLNHFCQINSMLQICDKLWNLGCLVLRGHRLHAGLLRKMAALELFIVFDLWLIADNLLMLFASINSSQVSFENISIVLFGHFPLLSWQLVQCSHHLRCPHSAWAPLESHNMLGLSRWGGTVFSSCP